MVSAKYRSSGRKFWKVFPSNSDPPDKAVVSGVGGSGAVLYLSERGGITGAGGFRW